MGTGPIFCTDCPLFWRDISVGVKKGWKLLFGTSSVGTVPIFLFSFMQTLFLRELSPFFNLAIKD